MEFGQPTKDGFSTSGPMVECGEWGRREGTIASSTGGSETGVVDLGTISRILVGT